MSFFRLHHTLALPIVIACGYWLRFHAPLPAWLRDAAGGALYVVALALLLAILAKRSNPRSVALWAFAITCAIEFLQMWRPVWLQAIRRTWPGRLILGTTFSWWDFPAYIFGGWLALQLLKRLAAAASRGHGRRRRPQRASPG